jgi:predicted ATPase with chaperone activity
VGTLAAAEQTESDQLEDPVPTGELALTGVVRAVKGVLPIVLGRMRKATAACWCRAENVAAAADRQTDN